jgi:hypothetical protein
LVAVEIVVLQRFLEERIAMMGVDDGAALAYSRKTSKYRSSNTPVSSSSYPNSLRERRRLVSTSSAYG